MNTVLQNILSRPKTVLTLMVVMIVAGIFAYISIPKEANPDIDVPVYYVSIGQSGVSPEDSERLLVKPMETELRGLEGLKELTSIASEGHAGIVLEFDIGSNKDKILADIRDKVDLAKASLPADADEPAVFETNFALEPTIIVTLSGNVPERTLYNLARQLKDEIEAISSVREANLKGTRREQLEVILDQLRLESYDITQQELLNALAQYNQLVPAGFIDDGSARFNVKLPGLVETAQDVYSIPIKQSGEGVVTLGDVAEIQRTFKDASSYTRVNGQPAMSLEVVKRIGTNIVDNNILVREAVTNFTKDWPDTIRINYMLDQSTFIYETLGSLQSSILTAISLVMIIVVGALGLRSGLLVGLAIPTSFMVGFLILAGMGMTLNMMVMFGLVLTVGMLVDGSIVMIEYADRKISEGLEPEEAYKRAAQLMLWPIVSSTATTLAAFLPLLLWPGVVGEFMSYLPIMVIVVLSASLLTALVFVPVTGTAFANYGDWVQRNFRLAQALHALVAVSIGSFLSGFSFAEFYPIIPMPEAGNEAVNWALIIAIGSAIAVGLLAAFIAWIVAGLILRWRVNHPRQEDHAAKMLSAEQELDPKKLRGVMGIYVRFLNRLSENLVGNFVAIAATLGIAVGTFVYYGQNNNGVEFFVEEEPTIAIVFIQSRGNLSGQEIRDLAIEVEEQVLQVQGIENTVLTATAPGGGGGGGGISLSAPQDMPADVVATMQIELHDLNDRKPAAELFEEIRNRTANLAGIKVEIRQIEGGPPTGKDIRLQVTSDNYDRLTQVVGQVRGFFDSVENLQDIEDGRPLPGIEWEIDVNREEAGRYNAGIAAVGSMVQLVTTGVTIGKYRPDDSEDEVDIVVRLPEQERSLSMLSELKLRTPNGQVPISNFIDVRPQQKVSSITRRDGFYAMDLKANLVKGAKFGDRDLIPKDKVEEIQTWLDEQDWPQGVRFLFRGADEDQQESGAFLGFAAVAALFLMFIILVTQFNSFYQSFLTLSTVVLAMVGVLIGMLVTGQKFSVIMTGTGIVALAGIVVNNAIVLIDTYNRLRHDGIDVHQAVLKTSAQRFRPIFLTTFTTVLGLIPMALAINFDYINREIVSGSVTSIWWVQMSTAVISGLVFSTLLTLVLIPVMLSLPTNFAELGAAIGNRRASRQRVNAQANEMGEIAMAESEKEGFSLASAANHQSDPVNKAKKRNSKKQVDERAEVKTGFTEAAE